MPNPRSRQVLIIRKLRDAIRTLRLTRRRVTMIGSTSYLRSTPFDRAILRRRPSHSQMRCMTMSPVIMRKR